MAVVNDDEIEKNMNIEKGISNLVVLEINTQSECSLPSKKYMRTPKQIALSKAFAEES